MNVDGLTRFIEKSSIPYQLIKKADTTTLKEALVRIPAKLRESVADTANEGYWVPISFYNKKNGNNRIYNKKLWENVIKNQRDTFIGSPMLSDHPAGDSDGNPKDICGVWLDAKLGAEDSNGIGLVYGLLIPSGHIGEDLKDHLSKGLRIGTSSSGFGKLLPDRVTVDPDTFQIERLADWVLNPSQGTFFAYDEAEDRVEDTSIKESQRSNIIANIRDIAERDLRINPYISKREVIEHILNVFKELSEETVERVLEPYEFLGEKKIENNTLDEYRIKENVVKDSTSKLTKLEEKKFRRDMESFLESANKIEDPQERLEEFRDIKTWLEDGACPDLREAVEKKIAEEEQWIRTALKEKLEYEKELEVSSPKDLKEKLTLLNMDTNLLKEESENWKDVSKKLQEKYNQVKSELSDRPTQAYVESLKEKNTKLQEDISTRDAKMKQIVEKLTESFKAAEKEVADYSERIKELEAEKQQLTEKLEDASKQLPIKEALGKSTVELGNSLKEANEKNERLLKIIEAQRTQIEKLSEKKTSAEQLAESRKEELSKATSALHKVHVKEAVLATKAKEELREKASDTITDYYDKLYEAYGNDIVPFERKLKGCKTLAEAKKVFLTKVLQKLPVSQRIEKTRLPETLSMKPEQRAKILNESNFKKHSILDNKPEGWI